MSASNTALASRAAEAEARAASSRNRIQRRLNLAVRGVYLLLACFGAFLMAFPVFWMISTALKVSGDVFTSPPVLFPLQPQWHNFSDGLTAPAIPDGNFLKYVWNTSWYTVLEVIGDTLSGA